MRGQERDAVIINTGRYSELPPPRRWQFGTRSLLLAMVYVAVSLAIARWWGFAALFIVAVFAAPVVFCGSGRSRLLRAMKCGSAYLAVSIATLPYLDSWWLGELPVLAVLQLPKTAFADSIRTFLIYHVMPRIGLSHGSWSPDAIFVSPYALALAYLIPTGVLLAAVSTRTRMSVPYRYWAVALVLLAIVDFLMMRRFASGPGLSIY